MKNKTLWICTAFVLALSSGLPGCALAPSIPQPVNQIQTKEALSFQLEGDSNSDPLTISPSVSRIKDVNAGDTLIREISVAGPDAGEYTMEPVGFDITREDCTNRIPLFDRESYNSVPEWVELKEYVVDGEDGYKAQIMIQVPTETEPGSYWFAIKVKDSSEGDPITKQIMSLFFLTVGGVVSEPCLVE